MTLWDEFMAEVSAANERRWERIVREMDAILWGITNAAIPPYGVLRVLYPPPVPDDPMPLIVEVPGEQSPPASSPTPA